MDLDYHEMDMQLASANDQIKELNQKIDALRAILIKARTIAVAQTANNDLWKPPMGALGQDLQQALRDLHGVLKNES